MVEMNGMSGPRHGASSRYRSTLGRPFRIEGRIACFRDGTEMDSIAANRPGDDV